MPLSSSGERVCWRTTNSHVPNCSSLHGAMKATGGDDDAAASAADAPTEEAAAAAAALDAGGDDSGSLFARLNGGADGLPLLLLSDPLALAAAAGPAAAALAKAP